MTSETKTRKCIFCDAPAGNAEHVFPDWLSKVFGQKDSMLVMEQEGGVSRTIPGKIFQHKVKSVCQKCNNGWMSKIENNVKDYLGGIATGTQLPIKLDSDMQRSMAIWAQKTFLIAQSLYPSENRNATDQMFKEMYGRKDVLLLSATFIGFNEYHAESDGRAAGIHMTQVPSVRFLQKDEKYFRNQIKNGKRLIVGSMKVGHINFFLVASDFENSTMEFNIPDGMLKLQMIAPTPQRDLINWPTTVPCEAFGGWEKIHKELMGEILITRS